MDLEALVDNMNIITIIVTILLAILIIVMIIATILEIKYKKDIPKYNEKIRENLTKITTIQERINILEESYKSQLNIITKITNVIDTLQVRMIKYESSFRNRKSNYRTRNNKSADTENTEVKD